MSERLVVVTTAPTFGDSCRPAFRPGCECRRRGTHHGLAWPVRASRVLTGRPLPGARHVRVMAGANSRLRDGRMPIESPAIQICAFCAPGMSCA